MGGRAGRSAVSIESRCVSTGVSRTCASRMAKNHVHSHSQTNTETPSSSRSLGFPMRATRGNSRVTPAATRACARVPGNRMVDPSEDRRRARPGAIGAGIARCGGGARPRAHHHRAALGVDRDVVPRDIPRDSHPRVRGGRAVRVGQDAVRRGRPAQDKRYALSRSRERALSRSSATLPRSRDAPAPRAAFSFPLNRQTTSAHRLADPRRPSPWRS